VDSSKEFEKERNRIRQRKVSERRRKSGYTSKRLHFSQRDLQRLAKLATSMGFDAEKMKSEDTSSIISYCLAITCEVEKLESGVAKPKTKERMYRYRIRNVIRHHLKQEKKSKDKYKKTVEFLTKFNYKLPVVTEKVLASIPEDQREHWCEAWIHALVTIEKDASC